MKKTGDRRTGATIGKVDCLKAQKLWREGYQKCEIAKSFGLNISSLNHSMKMAGLEFGERNHKADPDRMTKVRKKGFSGPGEWKKTIILPPKKEIFVPWSYRR